MLDDNTKIYKDESDFGKLLLDQRKFSIIKLKNEDGMSCNYKIIDIN